MERIHTEQEFNARINQGKPTVAVFKAAWCQDCHYIEPFMPQLEHNYAGQLTFVHIDRDELPELCTEYNILGIPSFIVFRERQELMRFVSKLRKTQVEIEQFLDLALKVNESVSKV